MQMAKVSVAVEALHNAGIPFISVLNDPTYGGVSASYAMQADVKIAVADARIGFAGPAVILNTMCEANQMKYDTECPSDFQSAQYLFDHGIYSRTHSLMLTHSLTHSLILLYRSSRYHRPK